MNAGLYSSDDDGWATPDYVFNKLNEKFGPFDLDPAASNLNTKCEKYYTRSDNGLRQDWSGAAVFLNPTYGREILGWARKCAESRYNTKIICALLPGRTDSYWFQAHVLLTANELHFVKGRIKFEGAYSSAPFPSVVAIYYPVQLGNTQIYSIKF